MEGIKPKIDWSSGPYLRLLQIAELISRLHPATVTMCPHQLVWAGPVLGALIVFLPVQRNVAQALRMGLWCLHPTSNTAAQVLQDKKSSSQVSSLPTQEAEPQGLLWLRGSCYAQAMCLLVSTTVLKTGPYQAAHRWLTAFLQCEAWDQGQLQQTSSICPPGTWVGGGLSVLLEEVQSKLSLH